MPLNRRVARFNRLVANHFIGPVLIRMPGFGSIHHKGRKSGREFRTPVKLFRRGDDFIVTLPYGPGSDWVKNVIAAGGCELTTRGRRIQLTRPTLFVDDGTTRIPAVTRMVLARIDAKNFLALTPVVSAPAAAHLRAAK